MAETAPILLKESVADATLNAANQGYLESCKELRQAIDGLEEAVIAFTGVIIRSAQRLLTSTNHHHAFRRTRGV